MSTQEQHTDELADPSPSGLEASSSRSTHSSDSESEESWFFDLNASPSPCPSPSPSPPQSYNYTRVRSAPTVLVAPVEQPPHGSIEDDDGSFEAYLNIIFGSGQAIRSQGIDSESLDNHQRNVRMRVESQPPRANISVHLGSTGSSMLEPPPSPPETPTSSSPACTRAISSTPPSLECPICMKPLVEQMATWCGHIFCEVCIRAAIDVQAKCPICRRKASHGELRRIYFS